MNRRSDRFAPLLWPVTVPAAFFGMLFFIITRRHPPIWLLMMFGALVVAAVAWAIVSLILKS